jgi:hypothetical protein
LPPSRKYEEEDYMKKLILISVVFALVAGIAFAVDLGGTVTTYVDLLKGETDNDDIMANGSFKAIKLEGSGDTAEGKFGGWFRFDPLNGDAYMNSASGVAWWKPINEFKLSLGSNGGDGFFGKEGVTGWMFNQKANDDFAVNGGIWFGDWGGSSTWGSAGPFHTRYTFFEGVVVNSLMLEIKPLDMVGINIAIPYIGPQYGGDQKLEDLFKKVIAQVDLNFDFGNIAISYDGGGRAVSQTGDEGGIFVYYGGAFGDLSLDVGFSYHLAADADLAAPPLGFGLGLKYTSGDFGIKFRATAALGGAKTYEDLTFVNVNVLPYYAFSNSVAAFLNAGLGMLANKDDTAVGFFFNPYLRIGEEWGASLYIGFKLETNGVFTSDQDTKTKWSVPILLTVGF